MKRVRAVVFALLFFSSLVFAAEQITVTITVAPDEMLEIPATSFSTGVSHGSAGTAAGRTAQNQPRVLSITRQRDKLSPKLMEFAANGRHFKQVVLGVSAQVNNEKHLSLIIKMEDVVISSFKTSKSPTNSASSQEQVTFTYEKIQWIYPPQQPTQKPGTTAPRSEIKRPN